MNQLSSITPLVETSPSNDVLPPLTEHEPAGPAGAPTSTPIPMQASGTENAENAAVVEPVAGPSGTQNADDFRNILGDIDVPEGIDPSFLAALPEEMRQEVISEHMR
jgi:E3 ubiquitin-protein ligase HUWE1